MSGDANKCKNCDHFSGGQLAYCRAPVPFWAEGQSPRVYAEDGAGCAAHSKARGEE